MTFITDILRTLINIFHPLTGVGFFTNTDEFVAAARRHRCREIEAHCFLQNKERWNILSILKKQGILGTWQSVVQVRAKTRKWTYLVYTKELLNFEERAQESRMRIECSKIDDLQRHIAVLKFVEELKTKIPEVFCYIKKSRILSDHIDLAKMKEEYKNLLQKGNFP